MTKKIIVVSLLVVACGRVWCQEWEALGSDQGLANQSPADVRSAQQTVAPMQAGAAVQSGDSVQSWEQTTGVDSMGDEGRGDWYNKRKILKKARQLDEHIRQRVQDVEQAAEKVTKEHSERAKQLMETVAQLPVKQVDIDQALTKLTETIKIKSAEQEKRTDADRRVLVDLNDSKKLLSEFKEDFTYLQQIQQGVGQALGLITNQIAQCKAYEQQSWQLYERVDQTLNDRSAAQLFEEMQALSTNVESISQYISADLAVYLVSINELFQSQKAKFDQTYSVLIGRKVLELPKTVAVDESVRAGIVDAAVKKESQHGWFGTLWAGLTSFFARIWAWLRGWFI